MDLVKCGKFIAKKRKENNLTQKELAEKIGVSDKAVSKWETGRGFPEVSLLTGLAEALGVSVTELVNGEEAEPEKFTEQSDHAILEAFRYSKRMSPVAFGVVFALVGVYGILSPGFVTGKPVLVYQILGLAAFFAGVCLILGRRLRSIFKERGLTLLALLLTIVAILAEIPPYAIRMRFAAGPGKTNMIYASFFALLPYGYGIITPLLTAVMSCVLLLLGLFALFFPKSRKLGNACFIFGVITVFMSLGHIPFTGSWTVQAFLVTALLAAGAVVRAFANTGRWNRAEGYWQKPENKL